MPKPKHFKDGERCGFCYEEWPCSAKSGNPLSGIQQWKLQTELVLSAEQTRATIMQRRQRNIELNDLICEGLDLLGLPRLRRAVENAKGGVAFMVEIEELALLITKAVSEDDARDSTVG